MAQSFFPIAKVYTDAEIAAGAGRDDQEVFILNSTTSDVLWSGPTGTAPAVVATQVDIQQATTGASVNQITGTGTVNLTQAMIDGAVTGPPSSAGGSHVHLNDGITTLSLVRTDWTADRIIEVLNVASTTTISINVSAGWVRARTPHNAAAIAAGVTVAGQLLALQPGEWFRASISNGYLNVVEMGSTGALIPYWQASSFVVAGEKRLASVAVSSLGIKKGDILRSLLTRTTGATFDATEASTTNWEELGSSEVQSVAGKTGAVTIGIADVTDLQAEINALHMGHPYMESAVQDGYEVTASSEFSASYLGHTAFRLTPGTATGNEWATKGAATATLTLKMPMKKIFNRVLLKGRGGEYPTDWKIEGSNDDSTYTALLSKTATSLDGTLGEQFFSFTNTTAYQYYRFSYSAKTGTNPGLNRIRYFAPSSEFTKAKNDPATESRSGLMTALDKQLVQRAVTPQFLGHPIMAAATQNGYTVTKSSEHSATHASWKAFDDDDASAWITNGLASGDLTIQLPQAAIFNRVLAVGRDGGEYPTEWKIQGSNNGTTFTDLLDKTGTNKASLDKDLGDQFFDFTNTTAYLYYRFAFSASVGPNPGLSKLRYFFSVAEYALNKPAAATTTVAGLMSAADKTKLDGTASSAAAVGSTAGVALASAGATGTAITAARSDHTHAFPSAANVGAEPSFTTLSLAKGGTGAATAAAALTSLGAEASANKRSTFQATTTDTAFPTEKLVKDNLDLKAPLASPALTGAPTAPTAGVGVMTTQLATVQFVHALVSAVSNFRGFLDNNTDLPALRAAYSMRRLSRAWNGFCVRLQRSSDSTQVDVGFGVLTGLIDLNETFDTTTGLIRGESVAAWVGTGTATVATWYDQSGNGRHTIQDGVITLPALYRTGTLQTLNSKAAVNFGATDSMLTPDSVANAVIGADAEAISVLSRQQLGTTKKRTIVGRLGNKLLFHWGGKQSSATVPVAYWENNPGAITGETATTVIFNHGSTHSSTSLQIYRDGAASGTAFANPSTSNPGGFGLNGKGALDERSDVTHAELLFFAGVLTATQVSTWHTNAGTAL